MIRLDVVLVLSGVCYWLSPFRYFVFLDAWSGDRSDPTKRRGDLELKLENPWAFSKASIW